MASIFDVAKEAGVSTATVSRVLNGSYSVTEEKKQRVRAAIEKVGYHRQMTVQTASSLPWTQSGKKSVVLAVCSDFIEPILHAFQATASAMGYRVAFVHYDSPGELSNIEGLLEALSPALAGILLLNCADNSPALQRLVEAYPLVQVGEPILQDAPNRVVYNDEIKMAQDAAEHLIAQGCKKIGMLAAEPTANVPLFEKKKRLNGYFLALMNHGLPVDHSLVSFVDVSIEGGYEGTKALLAAHPDMDAVIGSTDVMAQGAVYAIRRAGKTMEDIQVFSMDNNEVWDFTHADIPYIDSHPDEIGTTAAHVLHAAITGALDRDYRVVIRHTLECAKRFDMLRSTDMTSASS